MDLKQVIRSAIVITAVPILAYAQQSYYTAARGGGERGGADFHRQEGGQEFHNQGQEFHNQGQEFHNQGQEGQFNRQGNNYYNRNYNENVNGGYNAAGRAGAYERGYQQGANSSSGNAPAYYPTPMYSTPQQPYDTEPPVPQNQPYQYQYPN